jgi:hypothetical protein
LGNEHQESAEAKEDGAAVRAAGREEVDEAEKTNEEPKVAA